MIRIIVWLILWYVRSLKCNQNIFTFNITKQSLSRYPFHATKTGSQQTVYRKMTIEGISKLCIQSLYCIYDDLRCFTNSLNLAKSIHRTKNKLERSSVICLYGNKTIYMYVYTHTYKEMFSSERVSGIQIDKHRIYTIFLKLKSSCLWAVNLL